MKILLLGKSGQVGWELQRALAPLGELIALDHDSTALCGDFTQPKGLAETVRAVRPDVIVNAAAHTAVDKAESEPQLAMQINAESVAVLADVANEIDAWLVHYSTDYVFDGSGERPWQERDTPAPLSVYGKSKLAGEQAAARHPKHLIFRTSWVYGARGHNFARTMLRLAQEQRELSIINDQFGAPTGAELLADCTALALRQVTGQPGGAQFAGLYHLVASGCTTWFDYAHLVFEHARAAGLPLTLEQVHPVKSSAFATPARRPHNSRLDNRHFAHTFGLTLPDWQPGVERVLRELIAR